MSRFQFASPAQLEEAWECAWLHVTQHLSCPQIGRRLGMHPVTVRKRLDLAGVARPKRRRHDPKLVEMIAFLSAQGLTQRGIAARLGVSHFTVAQYQPRLRVEETP
jgi:DNA-binding transcriptional regulator LsrR (DeoR family)